MHPRLRMFVAALAIIACALVAGGCKKFNSRRLINEGNKLYKEGKFEKAAATFEEALKEEDLDVGHYNLGITYLKLFIPDAQSEQNKQYAARAAEEFAKWLVNHPKDNDARKMMTSVWLDSGDFEKALAYWQKEHEADPKSRDVMGQMATIHMKADQNGERFDEVVKWVRMDAAAAPNVEGKNKSLQQIGNIVWSKLSVPGKVVGASRIHMADTAVSALQEILATEPNNTAALGLLASLFNFRALAQGPSWAAQIDKASSQIYGARQRVLVEEAKKKAAEQAPAAPPPAPDKAQGT